MLKLPDWNPKCESYEKNVINIYVFDYKSNEYQVFFGGGNSPVRHLWGTKLFDKTMQPFIGEKAFFLSTPDGTFWAVTLVERGAFGKERAVPALVIDGGGCAKLFKKRLVCHPVEDVSPGKCF